jgi:beta-xylosidase
MSALEEFDVTVTFCFTPEHRSLALERGLEPHHTSPPQQIEEFAEFCAAMVRRYAPGSTVHAEPKSTDASVISQAVQTP